MWSAWHTNLSEMSFLHSSVITCQTEKGNLWYFFWVGGVLKMQTTKTLEDKNHVKPWNRAVIFVAKKILRCWGLSLSEVLSSFLQGHLTESQAGHFVGRAWIITPNLGESLHWWWYSFDLTVAKDMCLILSHPETKVENFCWPPICCLTKSPLLFSCMLELG